MRDEATQLDDIECEFMQQHSMRLPAQARASEVSLIENTTGRWKNREVFPVSRTTRAISFL